MTRDREESLWITSPSKMMLVQGTSINKVQTILFYLVVQILSWVPFLPLEWPPCKSEAFCLLLECSCLNLRGGGVSLQFPPHRLASVKLGIGRGVETQHLFLPWSKGKMCTFVVRTSWRRLEVSLKDGWPSTGLLGSLPTSPQSCPRVHISAPLPGPARPWSKEWKMPCEPG